MIARRPSARLAGRTLWVVLAVALLPACAGEGPTYEPVLESTALDGWQPPWPVARSTDAGTDAGQCTEIPQRWLVIGWDSADWRLVLPLVERGEMPNLAALMRHGVYGNLASFRPTVSPALWTTVATGLPPSEHGILHFYNQQPPLERWWSRLTNFGHLERRLYSNADRTAPAIWNELSARNRRVMIVGYHNTFPVERVDGLMVSNYLTQDTVADLMEIDAEIGEGGSDIASGLVYPPRHLDEVLAIQDRVRKRLPEAVQRFASFESDRALRQFLERSRRLDPDGNQRPYFLSRAWLYDQVVAEVAAELYPAIEPELAMVHFQSLDWAAHHFLYFDRPHRYERYDWDEEVRRELEARLPRYADTVQTFYRHMDEWLGRLIALTDEATAVVVLSDHGTGPGSDPDLSGYHDDAPPGILVASGPGIRRGRRVEGATLYDMMPTLMRGLDLPIAEDLPGRVLSEIFCPDFLESNPVDTIGSYRSEAFVPPIPRPADLDEGVLRQLESLGYLD